MITLGLRADTKTANVVGGYFSAFVRSLNLKTPVYLKSILTFLQVEKYIFKIILVLKFKGKYKR